MGKLGGEMKALAKHCGGSHKTVNDCIHIVQRFDHHLRALTSISSGLRRLRCATLKAIFMKGWRRGSANARCKMKWPRCALFCNRPGETGGRA